jgi:peptidoglycan/xylan/chitin deacetylase (PgdA/CDA1 family)
MGRPTMPDRVLVRVREWGKAMAGHVGGDRMARRLSRRVPRILLYHRFSRLPAWRCTHAATFERQLDYLQRHHRIVSMDEVAECMAAGRELGPEAVAITVDDAYEDFHSVALPLIANRRVPVTLYVPTNVVDGKEWLWPDRVLWMIRETRQVEVEHTGLSRRSLETLDDRRAAWGEIADRLLDLPAGARDMEIECLARHLGVECPAAPTAEFRSMSWEQVRDAAARGVTIGAHSSAHDALALEPVVVQRRLIADSRRRLEAELGVPVRHFAYPHGRLCDFDEASVNEVRAAGFLSAASAVSAPARLPMQYALPRFAPAATPAELRSQLSGLEYIREWMNA